MLDLASPIRDTRSERGKSHEPVPHLLPPCRRSLCAARHVLVLRRRGARHPWRCFAGRNLDAGGSRCAASGWLTLARLWRCAEGPADDRPHGALLAASFPQRPPALCRPGQGQGQRAGIPGRGDGLEYPLRHARGRTRPAPTGVPYRRCVLSQLGRADANPRLRVARRHAQLSGTAASEWRCADIGLAAHRALNLFCGVTHELALDRHVVAARPYPRFGTGAPPGEYAFNVTTKKIGRQASETRVGVDPLRRDPLDSRYLLAQGAVSFFEVVVGLQAQPKAFAGAERDGESHGSVGTDAALAQHDFVDATRWHASSSGEGVLADAEWRQEFLEQHFARMDVGQGLHIVLRVQW